MGKIIKDAPNQMIHHLNIAEATRYQNLTMDKSFKLEQIGQLMLLDGDLA